MLFYIRIKVTVNVNTPILIHMFNAIFFHNDATIFYFKNVEEEKSYLKQVQQKNHQISLLLDHLDYLELLFDSIKATLLIFYFYFIVDKMMGKQRT